MSNWEHANEQELEDARQAYPIDSPKHPDYAGTRLKDLVAMPEPNAALNNALAQAQGEFPTIPSDQKVDTGTYKYAYADLAAILAATRPALAKHGLAVTQLLEAGGIRTELRHKDGGLIASSFPFPRTPENPQQLGSLITYLRRYTITAMLGIAAEDDDDAQQASQSQFKAPKPKRVRDASGEAEEVVDYLSEAQRKKIYALSGKLVKAEVFTEEAFDEAVAKEYEATVTGLTRQQASHLIDRLEKVERDLPTPDPA